MLLILWKGDIKLSKWVSCDFRYYKVLKISKIHIYPYLSLLVAIYLYVLTFCIYIDAMNHYHVQLLLIYTAFLANLQVNCCMRCEWFRFWWLFSIVESYCHVMWCHGQHTINPWYWNSLLFSLISLWKYCVSAAKINHNSAFWVPPGTCY